jgi:hypothetical protein
MADGQNLVLFALAGLQGAASLLLLAPRPVSRLLAGAYKHAKGTVAKTVMATMAFTLAAIAAGSLWQSYDISSDIRATGSGQRYCTRPSAYRLVPIHVARAPPLTRRPRPAGPSSWTWTPTGPRSPASWRS